MTLLVLATSMPFKETTYPIAFSAVVQLIEMLAALACETVKLAGGAGRQWSASTRQFGFGPKPEFCADPVGAIVAVRITIGPSIWSAIRPRSQPRRRERLGPRRSVRVMIVRFICLLDGLPCERNHLDRARDTVTS